MKTHGKQQQTPFYVFNWNNKIIQENFDKNK